MSDFEVNRQNFTDALKRLRGGAAAELAVMEADQSAPFPMEADQDVMLPTPREPEGYSKLDAWPTISPVALHGLAGDVVRLLEPHTEADPVALLASFLAEVGCMVGRAPHLMLDGSYHPVLFWPVLVGQSSKSRKGTAGRRIESLCQLADPDWTRGESKGNLSTGEGLAYSIRDPEYKDEPVKENGRLTGETKSICIDLGVQDKRLFLVQSEFGAVLRVMARDGNSLSGALRDAWDGLDLAPMTKSNRVKATAPHVGIVGHVTKDELLRNLTDTEASNGFGNRFVWLAAKRSKELPFPSMPEQAALDQLAGAIRRAVQYGRTCSGLSMTEAGREFWKAIYHDLSADRPGMAGALLGRAEAQVMRLAGLYAILDCQAAIDGPHLKAAVALWEFAEGSTVMIFGDNLGDPVADTIYRAIQAHGEQTDTQISGLFGRNFNGARLERAKALLATSGKIHSETVGQTGGRARTVWRLGTKLTNLTK